MSSKNKDKKRQTQQSESSIQPSPITRERIVLILALLSAICVYWPSLSAGWFYDDSDYVINDPRLERIELFLPGHWSSPPPSLHDPTKPDLVLPGYERPLIFDRYLWHLSFALERKVFGLNAAASHTINLLLHLASILALYFAVSKLVSLYVGKTEPTTSPRSPWQMLPALAALIFAVHPWASEPVCYVSARNGSMGTLFTLIGVWLCASAVDSATSIKRRIVYGVIAVFCAAAAYGSKENFIVAPAIWLLVLAPYLLRKLWAWSKPGTLAGAAAILLLTIGCGWMGIQFSDRARGLLDQSVAGFGMKYLTEVQSPLVLQTLADQIPCQRISLESNHPGWSSGACTAALLFNGLLLFLGTLGAIRWPVLLGLGCFYLGVLPTNSFLPRPDFLAMRNFYLPTACIATLLASIGIIGWSALNDKRTPQRVLAGIGVACVLFWAGSTFVWATSFTNQEHIWARSAAVAPDHSAVRLNHAVSILKNNSQRITDKEIQEKVRTELTGALAAEDSPTMALHNPRPKSVRRALAYRGLGSLSTVNREMKEAEQYYRKSFAEQPLTQTWAAWADLCFTQNWHDKVGELVAMGEANWPSSWWTSALRGLHKSTGISPENMPLNVQQDLAAAESAPDSRMPELRSIQARAIFAVAQTPAGRQRLNTIIPRLKAYGVSDKDLAKLNIAQRPK